MLERDVSIAFRFASRRVPIALNLNRAAIEIIKDGFPILYKFRMIQIKSADHFFGRLVSSIGAHNLPSQ